MAFSEANGVFLDNFHQQHSEQFRIVYHLKTPQFFGIHSLYASKPKLSFRQCFFFFFYLLSTAA